MQRNATLEVAHYAKGRAVVVVDPFKDVVPFKDYKLLIGCGGTAGENEK